MNTYIHIHVGKTKDAFERSRNETSEMKRLAEQIVQIEKDQAKVREVLQQTRAEEKRLNAEFVAVAVKYRKLQQG